VKKLKTVPVKYYSTNLKSPEVSFREALLAGLAPDGGLYMPTRVPALEIPVIESFCSRSYHDIAFTILDNLLRGDIEASNLEELCHDAYRFNVPIEKVIDNSYLLRLDQGPTASFKDFAARVMARVIGYFTSRDNLHFTVLTATSGDTGSAVANAFHGLKNIDVIILFPVEEVTETQRKQMTTLGQNIHVIAIDGKFDDCQQLVKKAFMDPALSYCSLTSANSINIGRLLPQSIYYFYAWSRTAADINKQVIFSVPSGNFGNLMGGIIAREMGLPVKRMIISTNRNNEVPEYLKSGIYSIISPSVNCISSAMNVGHPSNLARVVALYGGVMNEKGDMIRNPDLTRMNNDLFGVSVSDAETRETIADFYSRYRSILEPHGAVAWKGLESYRETMKDEYRDDQVFISLETAHPAKFREEVSRVLGISPVIPESLAGIERKEEAFTILDNDYAKLSDFIRKH
jgi:threonine synthase